jgi:lipoyl(octanoyl) transferase
MVDVKGNSCELRECRVGTVHHEFKEVGHAHPTDLKLDESYALSGDDVKVGAEKHGQDARAIGVADLGLMEYRAAWALQEQTHAEVQAGGAERILVVEHPSVITLGRRGMVAENLVTSEEELARLGIDIVETDRGGDITFHGPGQIVVYPIIRLVDHKLSVGCYVHRLEEAVIATLGEFGILTKTDSGAVGVWVEDGGKPAKICAIGVRVRRGVSLHGIALNVTTDLDYFKHIVPCGLKGRGVTNLERMSGVGAVSIEQVKQKLLGHICEKLALNK